MPRGSVHFSAEELVRVLSHYDTGIIYQVKPLAAGSRRVPKMVIISERGKFLLKRRQKVRDDIHRVLFAHAVQAHLAEKLFPVISLVPVRNENNTILQLDNHIYEFFKFITGFRYDGSSEATIDTGSQLAKFHQYLEDFSCPWKPPKATFHNSVAVRRHLKTIETQGPHPQLQETARALMSLYDNSSNRVDKLGFDSWGQQVVHGDWHPGNMLFYNHKLTAVLDFDSVKLAPPVTDLANGMLQFSIVGNRPNPADWPDYLDQAKLVQFLNGYQQVIELEQNQLNSLLDLMVETIIAEAVLPVAQTGSFGNLSGADFLTMIHRKAQWIDKNREKLAEAINS